MAEAEVVQPLPEGARKVEHTDGETYVVDADGWVLLGNGERDKRYRYPLGTRPPRASGKSRQEKMNELLGPDTHDWEYVRDGHDPNGVKSISGANLKRFYVLRDKNTGKEVMVGRGEMTKYAGVTPPRKRRGAQSESDFNSAMAEDDTGLEELFIPDPA